MVMMEPQDKMVPGLSQKKGCEDNLEERCWGKCFGMHYPVYDKGVLEVWSGLCL